MNKTAIKNFAVWARRKLISDITNKAKMLGVDENGIAEKLPQSTDDLHFFDVGTKTYAEVAGNEIIQREALVKAIKAKEHSFKNYKEAFENVVEETAYTWFNRLVAIRFMEVNDYLPSGVRVLSSINKAKNEPDFVTTPFDTDLEFTPYEQDRVIQLKDENKLDELFRMLFIKQCNKLHDILPELFEKTNDYTELLLNVSFTDKDGVVYHLVHDIDEDDFNVEKQGQVEIIGWLYQYYNIEPKDKVFSRPSGQKIRKEDIPAATQLFTPHWIVRYMVENSLGRIVIHNLKYDCWSDEEKEKIDVLKEKWKYYIEEAEQTSEIVGQFRFEERHKYGKGDLPPFVETTFLDPCMGSGHILVYAFDVFLDIYRMQGYTDREAVRSILENNLFGLEIDDRATQLAYFSIMMKARFYDRRFLTRKDENGKPDIPKLNICSIQESNAFVGKSHLITSNADVQKILDYVFETFVDAKEYGSILNVEAHDYNSALQALDEFESDYEITYDNLKLVKQIPKMRNLVMQAKLLSQKYEVVCTNPPYMGGSGMDKDLSNYVKKNYPDSKSDLFAVFIEKCGQMTKGNGYQAMITQQSWMFLSSFEKLRKKLLLTDTINMAHLGARAFDEIGGEVVQTTSFVLRKSHTENYNGTYCRLIEPKTQKGKEDMFLSCENRYIAQQENFSKIPGSPIAYWVSSKVFFAFSTYKPLRDICAVKNGMSTTDNNRFLRQWYECKFEKIGFSIKNADEAVLSKKKWFPYNKGGEFRKYYGNIGLVVNWESDGKAIKKAAEGASGGRIVSQEYYFMPSISWSKVTAGQFVLRYFPKGFLFDVAGPSIFADYDIQKYVMGLMNSKVKFQLLDDLYPTINYEMGQVSSTPIFIEQLQKDNVCEIVQNNIDISKQDWDSFETSWDFKRHPMLPVYADAPDYAYLISDFYEGWVSRCDERFNRLKANEKELNRIFIDIYGLQDELTPEVEDKDVTVRKADLQRDIKSLISYAVGCMFGRYSLDTEGIVYAGGEWNSEKYKSFIPDEDNCIPITDTAYFEDDIVGRFCEFVKVVYGEDTLEANLEFIAKALGNKGNTSRDIIRNYFLNDFFKDHCKIYQKRPIYWLFDSGKQNGFKALCYMHRWNADTIGNMRVEYLHRIQRVYEKELERMQEIIDNSRDNKEISNATKRKEKLQKQIKETKDYDAKVAHLALSRIDIDLDDGVKVNYEKVQTGQDGKKLQILAKI